MNQRFLPKEIKQRESLWPLVILVGMFLTAVPLLAQTFSNNGFVIARFWSGSAIVDAGDAVNGAVKVNCTVGCSAGGSFADSTAFTFGTTPVSNASYVVDDVAPNAVAENSAGAGRMTAQRIPYADLSKSGANTTAFLVTGTGGTFPVTGTIAATQSGTWTVQPGNTVNTTPWIVETQPNTGCGATLAEQAWAAVPTSSTAVFASTTCVSRVQFCNTNATSQTISLTDNAGTPIVLVNAMSLQGLSCALFDFGGTKFTTGVKWFAGGTGVTGAVLGYQ